MLNEKIALPVSHSGRIPSHLINSTVRDHFTGRRVAHVPIPEDTVSTSCDHIHVIPVGTSTAHQHGIYGLRVALGLNIKDNIIVN